MQALWIVMTNTFREGLRRKFLFVLIVFCMFILCISWLLGQISLDEKTRLMINFGLTAIQLSLLTLSVFLGNHFISGDLEKQRLLTILTRPIRPSLFFLGRYLGLALIIFISLIILASLLSLFFFLFDISLNKILLTALVGLYLESLLLLSFVLFFASQFNSFLVSVYGLCVFIIGHFLDSLNYFVKEGESFLSFLLPQLILSLPNLERVNWKSNVIYGDSILFNDFVSSSIYILFWQGFILGLALLFLEKREYN